MARTFALTGWLLLCFRAFAQHLSSASVSMRRTPGPTPPPVAPTIAQCKRRLGDIAIRIPDVQYGAKWVGLVNATFGNNVEELVCPTDTAALADAGIESCDVGNTYEKMITWKFKPGQFDLTRLMFLPANTAIIGAANPNNWQDHRQKPDVTSNTYFVGTTDQPGNDWVTSYGNMKPEWSRGFVMNNRTVIRNINVQGSDLRRRSGSYTGGAAFELPGCNTDLVSSDGMACKDGSMSMTGNGQPVHDVVIENVRINDLLFDHGPTPYRKGVRATQGLFYNGMIPGDKAHRNITLNNAVSMFSWADGVNVHGNIVGFYSNYLYIESPGDDSIGLWGVGDRNTPETNVHFKNLFSYDSGHPDTTGACMKAFGTGPDVTFTGYFVCCSPESGMGHPEDPDHGGVAVWLSPCCTADWDPDLHAQITIDAEFAWATIDETKPHDMCTERQCNGNVCNPWSVGTLLLPGKVQMPPYYGRFGPIANTHALVLTNKTMESCPGPEAPSCGISQDTDYHGHDYASAPAVSPDACCAACSADSMCQVAILYRGTCYMKNGLGAAQTSPGRVAVFPGRLIFM